jgi:hypothetical protein
LQTKPPQQVLFWGKEKRHFLGTSCCRGGCPGEITCAKEVEENWRFVLPDVARDIVGSQLAKESVPILRKKNWVPLNVGFFNDRLPKNPVLYHHMFAQKTATTN